MAQTSLWPDKMDQSVVIRETTFEAEEMIKDTITGENRDVPIRPHSGLGRKNGTSRQASVTNLVDFGNLLNSFKSSFPTASIGIVATNLDYAQALEEGTNKMVGFFFVRGVAKIMERKFKDNIRQAIKDSLK